MKNSKKKRKVNRKDSGDKWRNLYLSILKLRESQKETDRQIKENQREIKELRESQKETDRQIKENQREIKELRESQKETDRQIKENQREIKELRESQKETDKYIKNLAREIGRVSDSYGKFVEGMVEPSVVNFAESSGYSISGVLKRVKKKAGDKFAEFDIVILCEKGSELSVFIIEAKSSSGVNEVKEFIEKLKDISVYFPEYSGHNFYGVFASSWYGEGLNIYAQREGLWFFGPKDGVFGVLNPPGFSPKVWN